MSYTQFQTGYAQPRSRCWFWHDWYTAHTCATYPATGPLPGEAHAHDGQGQGGYRYERVCMQCGLRQYQAYHERWLEVPLPLEKMKK